MPLRLLEGEVAERERRLDAARATLRERRTGFATALRRRLARGDALAAAAGLGAVYGLWVSRPARGAGVGAASTAYDTWRLLRRSVLSALFSRLTASVLGPSPSVTDIDDA